jgi:hypothetical protein
MMQIILIFAPQRHTPCSYTAHFHHMNHACIGAGLMISDASTGEMLLFQAIFMAFVLHYGLALHACIDNVGNQIRS